jgi:hypothetical protein
MQNIINSVLVADGTSDRVLIGLIDKLMHAHCPSHWDWRSTDFVETYPGGCRRLSDRMHFALTQYPSDLVFVHRDAERRDALPLREAELADALRALNPSPTTVLVVPVRMTETWLLTDEKAIRDAAGNGFGLTKLDRPPLRQLESVDAKRLLFAALTAAAGINKRRSAKLKPDALRHRVVDFIDDLSGLRSLPSFNHFETQLKQFFAGGAFAGV